MFCGKCGAEIEANSAFCQNCGEKIPNSREVANVNQYTYNSTSVHDKQNKKSKLIGLVTVGIIVIIVLVLGMHLFGGRTANSTIKKFVDGQMQGKAEVLIDLFPQDLLDGICEEEGYLNKKELISVLDEELQEQLEQVDDAYGKGWKYSYEIVETEDYSIDDLRDMRQDYQEDYNIKLDIEAAKEVRIEIITSSKNGEDKSTSTATIDIMKIGGSWYMSGI